MLSEANGLSRRAQRCFAQHDTALPILVVKFHIWRKDRKI